MPKPGSNKQWVLGAALGLGLVGLMLKMTDVGPDGSTAALGERAGRLDERAAAGSAPTDRAEVPAAGGPARDGEESRATPGEIAALPPTGGGMHAPRKTGSVGADPAPAKRESARARARARKRNRRNAPSLEAGTAGELQGGTVGESTRPSGGRGPAGASLDAGRSSAPERAQAEAPTPPPAVFESGEEAYSTDTQVEVPEIGKIAGGSGTLSFWVQPQWGDGNQDDATLLELGDGRLQVVKNVNYLRFEFTDDAGTPGGLGAPITAWKLGEWHQVTTTWNGNAFALYVDGQLVSQTVQTGPFQLPPEAALRIGSNFPLSRPVAQGYIGRVDVRGRPLGPGEIARRYAAAAGQPPSPR